MMDQTYWQNDDYWVSSFNYLPEVREGYQLPEKVLFHDVTLRDGEQSPGVVFRAEEKERIAQAMDEVGIDRIEVALPAVSTEDEEAVRRVVGLRPKAKVFVLSRGMESDVNLALSLGVDGIILELPVGTPRLKHQFPGWTEKDVSEKAAYWGEYAKDKGLEVVLFPMDCTRSEHQFFYNVLELVGAKPFIDGVALVDTTGSLTPQATVYLVKKMKEITGKRIEMHTHTDFGMGVANSMAALTAGAEVIHASVAGIGERTGNTPLEEAAVTAKTLYGVDSNLKLNKLPELAALVQHISGFDVARNKPLIGERAFTRESGMGVNLVKEMPLALFGVHPRLVGRQPEYVLGKKSGLASVTMKLEDLGMPPVSSEQERNIMVRVKDMGISKKALVTDDEFRQIVTEVVNGQDI